MPTRRFPSRSMRTALPVLLLSLSCALYACAGKNNAPAPAPADPDREHSQGAPLQSSPAVAEQRIGEPAPSSRAQAAPAQQPAAAPRARPAPPQAGPGYIIIQPGETLGYIGALYSLSEKDLIAWNGLSSAQDIRAGQRLAIRPPANMARTDRAAPPAPQAQAPVASPASDGVILVAAGESLSTIAKRHNVTVAQLREWNGLANNKIRVGQSLRVQPPLARASGAIGAPAAPPPSQEPGAASATHDAPDADGMITVQSGQSLSGIAAKYKVSTANLRKWNSLKNDRLKTGQKLRVKAPVRVHTVKAGESLGRIASKYKVSTSALMQKNKLTNADVLPVGKELIIP